MEITKFQTGDKAIVCGDVGFHRTNFLKHFIATGREVEIAGLYTGWKGEEAYHIKIDGRASSEILLAEELEHLKAKIE